MVMHDMIIFGTFVQSVYWAIKECVFSLIKVNDNTDLITQGLGQWNDEITPKQFLVKDRAWVPLLSILAFCSWLDNF